MRHTHAPSDLQPDQPLAIVGRAQSHEALGNREAAIADYSSALARDPKQWEAMASRGVLHYEAGNLTAALDDFNRAIELMPDQPDLYQNRAIRASWTWAESAKPPTILMRR